jgi:hypothetical protein
MTLREVERRGAGRRSRNRNGYVPLRSCAAVVSELQLSGPDMVVMHRYSTHEFNKLAATQRRSKWIAVGCFLLALGVLSVYLLQSFGVLR